MSVLARIQAHPDRAHLHQPLAESLGLTTEIVLHSSDPPDPWDGYRACLSGLPDISHLLVIQDDAQVSLHFGEAVRVIASKVEVPVCLFLGGFPQGTARMFRRALIAKKPYIPLLRSPIVPLVAVLWPKAKAEEFLVWAQEHPRMTRADDGNAGRWHRDTKQEILVAVPSLVEHPDMVPSVKGGQQARWGKDYQRRAVVFAEDALDYEW